MKDLVGQQIDTYRIDALLGEGGMGAVYRGYDLNLALPVAVKVMHANLARQPQFQQRFLQEARAAARLGSHANIITVYRRAEFQGLLYMVMEFVSGASLNDHIQRLAQTRQVVQLRETLALLAQVADALGHAHRQGVVHRDIKPDNVLLRPLEQPDREGDPPLRAIVTDFGLAKLMEGSLQTATGTFMGTLPYMSPEQCRGRDLDGRSDIYSLGIMLYQLATGRLPFDVKTPVDAVEKHIKAVPPLPSKIRPGLPVKVEAIILKAIAKGAEERFQKAEHMAVALRQSAAEMTTADVTQLEPPSQAVSLVTEIQSRGAAPLPSLLGEDLAAAAGGDQLVISRQGEAPRAVSLEKSQLLIGRSRDNDITLDVSGVSRQHARLERTTAGWQVVDLGSTNGTFLEGSQLLPHAPQAWNPGQMLRIGSYYLHWQRSEASSVSPAGSVYRPTMMPSVPAGATQIYSSSGQLSLVVNPTSLEVAPGSQVVVQVELLNQGAIVEHFRLSIEQLPASWVTLPQAEVQLMPGTRATLSFTIHPPRDSSATAGRRTFQVVVSAVAGQQEATRVTGTLVVQPYERFSLDVQPSRLSDGGTSRVSIQNRGNVETVFRVSGRDPAEAIRFTGEQSRLNVEPGQTETVALTLTAKQRPLLGTATTLPFEIRVGTAAGEQPQVTAGQLTVRPRLPMWLLPVVLFLCAGLTAAGAFIYSQVRDSQAAAATAEAAGTIIAQTAVASETGGGTVPLQSGATETANSLLAAADEDGDGLSNDDELALGTDPNNRDTDGDGLLDGQEVNEYGTDPKKIDSDGDLLSDFDELNKFGTSPTEADSDGDTVPDGIEVNQGTDPTGQTQVSTPDAQASEQTGPAVSPTLTAADTPAAAALTPTPIVPPSATPTGTPVPTSTNTPTATATATPSPTPTPLTAVAMVGADRHWLPHSLLTTICLDPCSTSTPEPSLGFETSLFLLKDSPTCSRLVICLRVDGLLAIYFPLNEIPAGATIERATLHLRLINGDTTGLQVLAGRATSSWTEGSTGRPTCDFADQTVNDVPPTPAEYRLEVTEVIQYQHANPTEKYGICLKLSGEGERTFVSRESLGGNKPFLTVTYRS